MPHAPVVVALPRHKFVTGATLLQLGQTICRYQKEVRIDFRHFINEHPTIKRLYFNTRQWNYLKRLVQSVPITIKVVNSKPNQAGCTRNNIV